MAPRPLDTTEADRARFRKFVNTDGPFPDPSRMVRGRCHVWTGYCHNSGYGVFWLRTGSVKAHRVSFVMHGGKIPRGWQVDHLCRNTSCVNPDHLQAVTDSENQRRKRHAVQAQLDLQVEAWEEANRDYDPCS